MDSEDEHKSVKGDSSGDMKRRRIDVPCGGKDSFDLDEAIRYRDAAKTEDDRQEDRYAILMQQAVIRQVANTLSIPRVSAITLLRYYNWDVNKAQIAWFSDEETVRKDVGLLEKQEEVEVPVQTTENTNINSHNHEDKKRTKRCPSPGCEFSVEFVPGSSSYDVVCRCGHSFCWNCVEDAHRPVDCDTVHKWGEKNSAESENKDVGCLHMYCLNPCRFNFCWLCLGDWSIHTASTGGYYACNMYEKDKARGRYDEEENIQKRLNITWIDMLFTTKDSQNNRSQG
ncbi:hypothetical protein MKW92_051585 [Papaver armeniacum]|nr:hypothetical protein MKW92_051585 [Papaver armeniacum]